MTEFIKNKYILYILSFLAITNLFGFLYIKDYDSIILLIALVIVTSYFSDNNIIQLSVALIGTNFIFVNNKVSEGLINQKKRFTEGFDVSNDKKNNDSKNSGDKKVSGDKKDSGEAFRNKRKRKSRKERFGTKGKKLSNNGSKLEKAYSNMSNVLGTGGIGNLTKETQGLLKQQKDLVKQMASLGPMIANVSKLTKGMPKIDKIQDLIKGISNIK